MDGLKRHGLKHLCRWEGCGKEFRTAKDCRKHEPRHTGVWPHTCTACGAGHPSKEKARRHCIVAYACVCGYWINENKGREQIKLKVAHHNINCTQSGKADTALVGSVRVRTTV